MSTRDRTTRFRGSLAGCALTLPLLGAAQAEPRSSAPPMPVAQPAGLAPATMRCHTTDTWVVRGRVDGRTEADFQLDLDLAGLRYRYDHWQDGRFARIEGLEGDTVTLYRQDIRFATLQRQSGQYKAMSVASGVELFSQGFCRPAAAGR